MQTSWFFPSTSSNSNGIVVAALSPLYARAVNGLQGQVEAIYRGVLASVGDSEDKATRIVDQNFHVNGDDDGDDLNCLVLAFHGSDGASLSDDTLLLGFSRIFASTEGGAHVTCTSLAVRRSLNDEAAFEIGNALFQATQEIGKAFADAVRPPQDPDAPKPPVVDLWRSQYATTQQVKDLFTANGYSTTKCERIEFTKFLTVEQATKDAVPEGFVVRPFDLNGDDLAQIYSVWKLAYGEGTHPSIEAWKFHYLQTPRLAPELSFVAWDGDTPVSGVFLEYIIEGEGGGDAEVPKLMSFSSETPEEESTELIKLAFPEDYAARQAKIRANATSAYVCAVATLPKYRGKRLARALMLEVFEKAQLLGLEKVFLSTNTVNTAAIKAYTAVGMVETNRMVSGTMTIAEI